MARIIVLGRFQPFHCGHAFLLSEARKLGGELVVAIGSSEADESMENPWSAEERVEMIQAWAQSTDCQVTTVCIPDIHDPPNWVGHATEFHGDGILATSDDTTAELYRDAGWEVAEILMNERQQFVGWRVRQTLTMLSTIADDDAFTAVMSESLPQSTIEWFLADEYRLFRLSELGPDIDAIG